MSEQTSQSGRDPLDALAESFLARFRKGERPSLTEYVAAHPDLADEILDLFPALVEIEGLKSAAPQQNETAQSRGLHRRNIPAQLGDYRILREIGRGGMGVVYEAIQESLGRRVALKVLPPELDASPTFLARFRREARSAAGLHHTNIVPVFGVGEADGHHYYAMQYIRGQTLEHVLDEVRRLRSLERGQPAETVPRDRQATSIARGLLTCSFELQSPEKAAGDSPTLAADSGIEHDEVQAPSASAMHSMADSLSLHGVGRYYRGVANLGRQVAEALAYAHSQGILHRDVKPSNLLLDANGVVWVTDFGLAKAEGNDGVTQAGDIVGTLRYMAPERFRGESDRSSDIYSLGITLYEMATLHHAFEAKDRAKLIDRVLHESPVAPRKLDPQIPRDLETIILKAIAKEPGDRFSSAARMADELQRFVDNRPIESRPITTVERYVRWCKRNPLVASLTAFAAMLTAAIAVIMTIYSLQLRDQRDALRHEQKRVLGLLDRASKLDRERRAELGHSYLAQAHATRVSRRVGQRFESLDAIAKSSQIARDLNEPRERFDALRDEAIAALALPDFRRAGAFGHHATHRANRDIDARMERYVESDENGTIHVYRFDDDTELFRFPAFDSPMPCWVLLNPTGDAVLAKSTGTGIYRLWSLRGEKPVLLLDQPAPANPGIREHFSPDGRMVAVTEEGKLVLLDLISGSKHVLSAADGQVYSASFHPDSRHLVVCVSRNGKSFAEIWTIESSSPHVQVELPTPADVLQWNPDGVQVVMGGADRMLYSWDTRAQNVHPFGQLLNGGNMVAFEESGRYFVTQGWESRLQLWDAQSGRLMLAKPGPGYTPLRFVNKGTRVIGSHEASQWRLEEIATGRECRTRSGLSLNLHFQHTYAVSPSGRLVAVCRWSDSPRVGLWDLDRAEFVATIRLGFGTGVMFDHDGSLLTIGPLGIQQWPVRPPTSPDGEWVIGPPILLDTSDLAYGEAARSADGRVLAVSAFWRGTFVMLRDQGRSHWLGPQPDVRKVAVSPDGRFVASASWNGNGAGTIVRDAQTGRQVAVLPGGDTGQPAFSPDGKWLAAGRRPSRIWRVEGWQPGPELEGNSASTFTPDGALVEFGYEQFVRFRDPETGRALATFEDPDQDRTGSIAFTPDGSRMICIAPETGRLHVWDLRSIREQLAQLGLDWERPKEPPSTRSTDTPATPLRVRIDSPDKALLPSLARDNVRYGRWNAAARDFKALLEIQPGEITNWHDFVVLQLKLGNEHEYKVACKRLLERFSNATDWYTTNSAAWSLSLGPDAGVDPEQIVSLARRALKLKPDDYSATNTLGAALYRAGRYQEALETLERAIALHGGGGLGFDMLLMALVKQALGQADEAREWCKRGVRWTRDAETGKISDPAITLPLEWEAHLELEMLCREAQFAVGLLVPTLPRDAFAHD